MTKPTLKERMEKGWLGRRVRTPHGDIGTVEAVSGDVYAAYPIIVRVGEDLEHYASHQLVLLKPKQKKPEVTYELIINWYRREFPLCNPETSPGLKSLCDLLGVKKK